MSRCCWPLLAVLLAFHPEASAAQLLSPGKLAAAHAELSGVRNCTQCHVLGERGISNAKCLECHESLAGRIAAEQGFHANLGARSCAACHKDHFGEDFDLLRFDTHAFDHATTGFELQDAHGSIECRDCHQPRLIADPVVRASLQRNGNADRTFLGLGTTCTACHSEDNPHGAQFGDRGCEECHLQNVWEEADRFDHDRTRYRLTGRHRAVECGECHRSTSRRGGQSAHVPYAGLSYATCDACHDDVHRGRMGGSCSGCHVTGGWHRLNRNRFESRFDHDVTKFALVGRHAQIECALCHRRGRSEKEGVRLRFDGATSASEYPRPIAADCTSCHLDFHADAFAQSEGGAVCESCHTQVDWLPTTYDLARHNADSDFELTGAHVAAPCQSCHSSAAAVETELRFHFESVACESCHETDDPHVGQFRERECAGCHETESFTITSFDHSETRYPLDGAHRDVKCNDCHRMARDPDGAEYRVYRPLGRECRDCHGGGS